MPVLFIGHGSPMNTIEDNAWSRGFASIGSAIATPTAIVAISAHWFVPGTFVTNNAQPETIHDFGGFPRALFEFQYPARGEPKLAARIKAMLADGRGAASDDWGLDHGTWSVLAHLRPNADVPVIQISIDQRARAVDHLAIGRALAPLRNEGALIMASGNLTHNLRHAFGSMQRGVTESPPWATSFDADIKTALEQRDHAFLARALDDERGRMAHPSPDHYLPLLYAAGASDESDAVGFPITGFDASSLSMRSVQFG